MSDDKYIERALEYIDSCENMDYERKEGVRGFAIWLDVNKED